MPCFNHLFSLLLLLFVVFYSPAWTRYCTNGRMSTFKFSRRFMTSRARNNRSSVSVCLSSVCCLSVCVEFYYIRNQSIWWRSPITLRSKSYLYFKIQYTPVLVVYVSALIFITITSPIFVGNIFHVSHISRIYNF